MSGFTAGRRGVARRIGHFLRRAGRVLWFLLKGASLGLGWCVALVVGIAALMIAGQSDAAFSPYLDHLTNATAGDGLMADHRGPLMMVRAMFMVLGGIGFLGVFAVSKSLENWWGANPPEEAVISASTARPSGDQTLRRTRRVLGTTWTVLLMLALGVAFGWGGVAMIGGTAGTLTSDDATVLRQIAETADWFGRPKSLQAARDHALFGFGFGLLIAFASLFGFFGAYFEIAEALGFHGGRDSAAK